MSAAIVALLFIFLFMHLSNKIDELTERINVLKRDTDNQLKSLIKKVKDLESGVPHTIQPPKETSEQPEHKPTNIQPAIHPDVVPAHIIHQNENITPEQPAHENKTPETPIYTPVKQVHYNPDEDVEVKKEIDIENLFIGNIFSKIGGIALVVAICFLVKLSSNYIEFTPQLNITLGYLVSIGLLGYSIFMYNKKIKVTAEILGGVSIAGLLLSTYFGCFYYNLFPIWTALTIAFVTAIISFIISENYKSFATIAIGLFGGYLNPAVFSQDVSINILFGYLIALNLISIAYTYRNGSKNIINCVNILMTIITLAIFSYRGNVLIVYPIILWLLYIVYDIVTSIQGNKQDNSQLLRWFNFAALIYITNQIFKFTDLLPIGLTILGAGLAYTALYYSFKAKNEEISLTSLQSALICILFMTYYLVRAPYIGLAWAVEGFLVAEIYLKLKNSMLQKYVLVFFIPAIIYLLIKYQTMFMPDEIIYDPIIVLLIYLGIAGTMVYSGYRLKEHDNYLSVNLKMLGFSVLYIYAAFYFNTKETFSHSKLYIDSIIAAIYSLHSYKLLSKDFKEFSEYFCYIFYGISAIILIAAECMTYSELDFVPILNIKFSAYLALLALTLYLGKSKDNLFNYFAVIIGMFALAPQINCMFQNILPEDTIPLVLTTILIVYSGIILTIGILKDIVSMKHTSIILILILLAKLILIDLYNIDAIFKLLAFVIIGFILLGVSSYYQKKK